jgi:hypothetical protein
LTYQTDGGPCVLICHKGAELRPREFSGCPDADGDEDRHEQALPVEWPHERERGKVDIRLEKLMERFCSHTTTINLNLQDLLPIEIVYDGLIVGGKSRQGVGRWRVNPYIRRRLNAKLSLELKKGRPSGRSVSPL